MSFAGKILSTNPLNSSLGILFPYFVLAPLINFSTLRLISCFSSFDNFLFTNNICNRFLMSATSTLPAVDVWENHLSICFRRSEWFLGRLTFSLSLVNALAQFLSSSCLKESIKSVYSISDTRLPNFFTISCLLRLFIASSLSVWLVIDSIITYVIIFLSFILSILLKLFDSYLKRSFHILFHWNCFSTFFMSFSSILEEVTILCLT